MNFIRHIPEEEDQPTPIESNIRPRPDADCYYPSRPLPRPQRIAISVIAAAVVGAVLFGTWLRADAATAIGSLEPAAGTWRAYRGTGSTTFVCSAKSEAAVLACAAADAERRAITTRYQIRYPNRYATVTYTVSLPPTDTQPPAVGALTAVATSSTQIRVTWPAATDNVGVTGYDLQHCRGITCENFATLWQATALEYLHTVPVGSTTRFQLRASDAVGNWSAYSNIPTVTTSPVCPPAPVPRQNTCPTGFTGTWTQTATVGPPPTCALDWQPVAPGAGACTPISQPPVTPIFTDRFEYDASRTSGPLSAFTSRGWAGGKANNLSGSGAGWIYTEHVPALSSRALVLESRPSTSGSLGEGFEGGQTDYYLQIGREDLSPTTIPANVWFQFKTFATPASAFARRDKTMYPCRTHYPCSTLGGSLAWMLMWGSGGFEDIAAPASSRFLAVLAEHADFLAAGEYPTNKGKLFQNVSKQQLVAGRWYVVKLHFDTSGAQGVYQAWVADLGSTTWTQLADWRGGVTPNFSWPIPADQRIGHRVLRLPTTVNGPGDSTTYLDDFTMSGSEAGLP